MIKMRTATERATQQMKPDNSWKTGEHVTYKSSYMRWNRTDIILATTRERGKFTTTNK